MKPLKTRISLTLDEDLVTQLKDLAEEDDRSLSQYINIILKKHISEREASENEKTSS